MSQNIVDIHSENNRIFHMSKQQDIYKLIQDCDHITVDDAFNPIFVDCGFGGKPSDPVIGFKLDDESDECFYEFDEASLLDAEIKNGNEIHLNATNGDDCILQLFRQIPMALKMELKGNVQYGPLVKKEEIVS